MNEIRREAATARQVDMTKARTTSARQPRRQASIWDVTKRAARQATADFYAPIIGLVRLVKRVLERCVNRRRPYIRYYNQERIRLKLNGLAPIEYRLRFAAN